MSELAKCRLCDRSLIQLTEDQGGIWFHPAGESMRDRTCPLDTNHFTRDEWTQLMGAGEPVAWMYVTNGVHVNFSSFEPPDDAYDEGTLVPLYTHQAPAVDDAVLRDAERLDWISRNPDFSSSIVVDRMHDGEYEIFGDNCGPFYGETFRDAIDSAMKGEG